MIVVPAFLKLLKTVCRLFQCIQTLTKVTAVLTMLYVT